MRLIVITALLMTGGCTRSANFRDATSEVAALYDGFQALAPLDVPEKARALAPLADKQAPALVAALEAMKPAADKVDCHADALAGARRAAGAMKDLLKVYRDDDKNDPAPRAVAAARNIDLGLTAARDALAICTR